MSIILDISCEKNYRCFHINTINGEYKLEMICYFNNKTTLTPALYVKTRSLIGFSRWKMCCVFSREHMEINDLESLTKEAAKQKFEPLIAKFESVEKKKREASMTWK